MKLLSVIVPVYNGEKYLARCIDSILEQTYHNIELILVNDGSKDKSLEICQEYALKDPRVYIIDKSNRGVSSARNSGIEYAHGEILTFVDCDDFIKPNMYESMISLMEEDDTDIVACNYQYGKWDSSNTEKVYQYSGEMAVLKMLTQNRENDGISVAPVDKIFKKKLFNGIRFSEDIHIAEDIECITRVLFEAKRITKLDRTLYTYFQNDASVMHESYSEKKIWGEILCYKSLCEYFKSKNQNIYHIVANRYGNTLLHHFYICKQENVFSESCVRIKKTIKMEIPRILFAEGSKVMKVKYGLFLLNSDLFVRLQRRLGK